MRRSGVVAGANGILLSFLPAIVFSAVYAATCLLGAVILLLDFRPIVSLFEHFTGTHAPTLTPAEVSVAVTLLLLPPLFLWAGFISALYLSRWLPVRRLRRGIGTLRLEHPSVLAFAVFALAALGAALSLLRAESVTDLFAWLNYQSWIDARWQLFQKLSFFEFVNIYTVVPITAAWVALRFRSRSIAGALLRMAPALISVGIALAIFQRKAAIIAMTIVLVAWFVDVLRAGRRPALPGLVATMFVGAAIYLVLALIPTAGAPVNVDRPSQRDRPATITPAPTTPRASAPSSSPTDIWRIDLDPSEFDPTAAKLLYAGVGVLMRTSAPALYYPIVFPGAHPFYPLDLAQDVVCSPRLGCRNQGMPDDNIVVWDYMNPQLHGGSIAAPFQFALYSQGGVQIAALGAFVLGLILAAAWRLVIATALPAVWAALLGASVSLLAINLAIDSPRNSILVSYGALWALLVLVILVAAIHGMNSIRPFRSFSRVEAA